MGQAPRYRLYLDESGDHVFHDDATLAQASHRYLALCGCWFRTVGAEYLAFADALEQLKRGHLPHSPDEPVVLHRKDILYRRGPFWRLRDADAARTFDEDLFRLVSAAAFTLVVVVVDKLKLKQKYQNPFHPYHMALDFVLQRYCGLLNHLGLRGDVMAESRGRHEDTLLKNAYRHVHTHGDMHHKASFYRQALSTCELKVKPKKANVPGLQLADLLANPCKQQLLYDCGAEAVPPVWAGSFGETVARAAWPKYNRHLRRGDVEGYGRVLFPKWKRPPKRPFPR